MEQFVKMLVWQRDYELIIPPAGSARSRSSGATQVPPAIVRRPPLKSKVVRNGFFAFMQKRKPELERDGKIFPGGFRDLSSYLDAEWNALSDEGRKEYRSAGKSGKVAGLLFDDHRKTSIGSTFSDLRLIAFKNGWHEQQMKLDLVNLINNTEPIEIKMVVINFSFYANVRGDLYIPAELGLTALSLRGGVVDNYWSLIDPFSIPIGLGGQALKRATELGLPRVGYSNKFQDYKSIVDSIQRFLLKHVNATTARSYVFCLRRNIEMNMECLRWLYDQIGLEPDIELYPLGEIVKQLSYLGLVTRANKEKISMADALNNILDPAIIQNFQPNEERIRKPSTVAVRAPALSAWAFVKNKFELHRNGTFFTEKDADDFLEDCENAYDSEICCLHHMKTEADGIHLCPLNVTNRYAFLALNVLVTNFDVLPLKGRHYFERNSPAEVLRRKALLEEWGQVESCLEFSYDGTEPPMFSTRLSDIVVPKKVRPVG